MFPDNELAKVLLHMTGRDEKDFQPYDFPTGILPVPTQILAADRAWIDELGELARIARSALSFTDRWKIEKINIVFFGPEAVFSVHSEDIDYPLNFVVNVSNGNNLTVGPHVKNIIRKLSDVKKKTSDNQGAVGAISPRWAEQNRPKKQVKLRLPPDLITALDEAAEREGVTRNDLIEDSIRQRLQAPALP